MYKQKQSPCHGPRRRVMNSLQNEKSRKKKLKIVQTYITSPAQSRSSSLYEMVERQKLQPLKKQFNRYVMVNSRSKYLKKVQTLQYDYEDGFLQDLKNLKSQIQVLKNQLQDKKSKQKEDEYRSEIKEIKSEIIQLRNLQKQFEEKRKQEEELNEDLEDMRGEIKQLKKEVKEKVSQLRLPPIHIYRSINLNPENNETPIKQMRKRQKSKRRPDSMNIGRQDERKDESKDERQSDLDELRQEVNQLRSELIQSRKPYSRNYSQQRNRSNQLPVETSSIYLKDRSRLRTGRIYSANPHSSLQNNDNSDIKWKKRVREQGKRKLKKVVNAILFTHRLQRFSQKIRLKRENFFKESFQNNIYKHINIVKEAYVKCTQQFVNSLPTTEQLSLVIVSTDTETQRTNKAGWARKYLNRFLDVIKETEFLPTIMESLTETCYFVCRHGSAGVISNYFTAEELDIMCVSKASIKVLAEKNLEKSQIVSFIWVKLIIFNVLFRTDTTKEFKLQNNPAWNANFCLFGSLVYELCRKIQAQLIERVPLHYVIGNWKHLNFLNAKSLSRKTINPSKSMTLNLKQHEKTFQTEDIPSQLLQGTISKKYLLQAYEYQNWQAEEKKILNYVQLIHRRICKYHAQLKDQLL